MILCIRNASFCKRLNPSTTVLGMAITDIRVSDPEKNSSLQVDDIASFEKDFKEDVPVDGADYSGAVAKTDPAEIALVKRLDYRIMPALFCMYFL
jgi:hypothetical protein